MTQTLDHVTLRAPRPDDAPAWAAFLAREQARTYAGQVPAGFEEHALEEADVDGLRALFADPGEHALVVAEADGRIVGLAQAGPAPAQWEVAAGLVPAPADRELGRLYVAPSWHGTGLADALFRAVMGDGPHYLWIIDGNERAARFYARRGFRHDGEQFAAGEDWGGVGMHRMVRDAQPVN